jgi:hypothetical protein
MTIQVLGAVLLVCLGLLLGSSWTIQAVQLKLRQQAEERRRLNEEWAAVRTARRQRGKCPRCGSPLSEQDWYFTPTLAKERPHDDWDARHHLTAPGGAHERPLAIAGAIRANALPARAVSEIAAITTGVHAALAATADAVPASGSPTWTTTRHHHPPAQTRHRPGRGLFRGRRRGRSRSQAVDSPA